MKNKGYSLIEVICAVAVFTIAFLPMCQSFVAAQKTAVKNDNENAVMFKAKEVIEFVMGIPKQPAYLGYIDTNENGIQDIDEQVCDFDYLLGIYLAGKGTVAGENSFTDGDYQITLTVTHTDNDETNHYAVTVLAEDTAHDVQAELSSVVVP